MARLERIWDEFRPHFGKIFGSLMGLTLGWIIIKYGIIRGFFVAICVFLGFYLGNKYDSRGDITDIVDRFLR